MLQDPTKFLESLFKYDRVRTHSKHAQIAVILLLHVLKCCYTYYYLAIPIFFASEKFLVESGCCTVSSDLFTLCVRMRKAGLSNHFCPPVCPSRLRAFISDIQINTRNSPILTSSCVYTCTCHKSKRLFCHYFQVFRSRVVARLTPTRAQTTMFV